VMSTEISEAAAAYAALRAAAAALVLGTHPA
jgi:hypothetical protein